MEIADAGQAPTTSRSTCPTDIEMEGDQDRLRQLFTNIIANALKHSADGTAVLIEAHENENFGTIVTNVVNFGSQIPSRSAVRHLPSIRQRQDGTRYRIGRNRSWTVNRPMGGAVAWRHGTSGG